MAELPASVKNKLFLQDALVACLIFGAASLLFIYQNEFRIGFHVDEKPKIIEAISGNYYFAHPLFLPRAMRIFVLLTQSASEYSVAFYGRLISALMGAVGVAAVFIMSKKSLGSFISALIALTVAASPLLAIHAHYIKEDAALFGFCALASIALCRLFNDRGWRSVLLAGVAVGFVAASKLVGIVLVLIYAITVLCQKECPKGKLLKLLVPVLGVAAIVFAFINFPAFFNLDAVIRDQEFAFWSATNGYPHSVYHSFDFYIDHSFIPDLGFLFCFLAAAGLALLIFKWRQLLPLQRFLTVYFIFYFTMISVSPYRNWPDYGRMTLPLLIPMAYFVGYSLKQASLVLAGKCGRWGRAVSSVVPAVLFFSLVPVGWDTLQILHDFKDDTRIALMKMMGEKQKYAIAEDLVTLVGRGFSPIFCSAHSPALKDGRYLVTSSFADDQIAYGNSYAPEKNVVAKIMWPKYQQLLQTPYCEIRPHYRSYAFSNPTLRVFSLMAINQGIKADPATNGRPCSAEIIAQLPATEGYNLAWSPLTEEEQHFFCWRATLFDSSLLERYRAR